MKKKKLLSIVCAIMVALSLVGCASDGPTAKTSETEPSQASSAEQTQTTAPQNQDPQALPPEYEKEPVQDTAPEEAWNADAEGAASNEKYTCFESFDIVLDESKNHKLLTDTEQTGYQYYVYDNHGEVIDCGYHDYRGCSFSLRDGYLVYYNGGLTVTWYERYYDLENGRVSKFFLRPLDTHKNLVAYYRQNNNGETVLAICDMFDNQIYYQEFEREFGPSVYAGGSEGSFSEDGKSFTVTYILTDHEAQKDTEVTETLQLS